MLSPFAPLLPLAFLLLFLPALPLRFLMLTLTEPILSVYCLIAYVKIVTIRRAHSASTIFMRTSSSTSTSSTSGTLTGSSSLHSPEAGMVDLI